MKNFFFLSVSSKVVGACSRMQPQQLFEDSGVAEHMFVIQAAKHLRGMLYCSYVVVL